jgi:hypothetical protein
MKVALLLFGQPRCIQKDDVYLSHKKLILDKYNTDVYMHCWYNKENTLGDTCFDISPNFSYIPGNAPDILINRYNPKKALFESIKKFELNDNMIEKCSQYFSNKDFGRILPNLLSQFYSIEAVNRLIYNDKDNYDFIILARYDHILYELPNLFLLNKNNFYVSDEHPRFPDALFIFGTKFIESQYTYTNITNLIPFIGNSDYIPDLNAEYFKKMQYYLNYTDNDIRTMRIKYQRILM